MDVQDEDIKLPMNGLCNDKHLKTLGNTYTAWMGDDDLIGMSLLPWTHILGLPADTAKKNAREAAKDILRQKYHIYNVMWV